ncbi:hypothetical protein PoB_003271100 [Plakobranchus ocellatus]|uniref:Uncharacterized protein n=1 Tax=Plakobranchus ocellatus TaxID=259542 RepID=A0AAV4A4N5_9GAST|nr:hypothetical protein PoB_003271100 [Plakobranchus ocellatus]
MASNCLAAYTVLYLVNLGIRLLRVFLDTLRFALVNHGYAEGNGTLKNLAPPDLLFDQWFLDTLRFALVNHGYAEGNGTLKNLAPPDLLFDQCSWTLYDSHL